MSAASRAATWSSSAAPGSGALVAQVTEEFRLGLTDETQRRIAVTRPPEPLLVDGDAARLEQVIRNLLSNAVKYSPDGGPIHISVARQGTEAALTVTDTGIGIPAEAQAQLFESFYRARNVGSISGLGSGCTWCRRSWSAMADG